MARPDDNIIIFVLVVFVNQLASITGETVSACFSGAQKSLPIRCGTGHMVHITKAFYGYSDNGLCSYTPGDCIQVEHEAYPCTGRDTCNISLPSGSFGRKLTNCNNRYSSYFQVEYSCEKVIDTSDICTSGEIKSDSGFISTPKYPKHYPDTKDCVVTIEAPHPSQSINLTIIDMDLQINGTYGCHDWLYAFNEDKSVTLCGRRTNEKLMTLRSNKISILFHSDQNINKKGFWVYYEAYPPLPVTNPPTQPTTIKHSPKKTTQTMKHSPPYRPTSKPPAQNTQRSTGTGSKESKEEKLPFVAIVAGVIGSLTFILIVLLILLVYRWWHDKQSYRHKSQHVEYLDARNPAFRSSTGTEFQGIEIYYNC